jgi:4'-phosphopantetheinyl transferase
MSATKIFWESAPKLLRLADSGIHVFCASLDLPASRMAQLAAHLSEDERARAERFAVEQPRQRFIAARGILREILGSFLDVEPAQLRFSYNSFGKPQLASCTSSRALHFNLAHSDSLAVYAIADQDIGIDLERIRPMPDAQDIAARFFSPRESADLREIPEERRTEAFFNFWTRKEACLKAVGLGLSETLNEIEVSLLPQETGRLFGYSSGAVTAARWSLQPLQPASRYIGALASKDATAVNCWSWNG